MNFQIEFRMIIYGIFFFAFIGPGLQSTPFSNICRPNSVQTELKSINVVLARVCLLHTSMTTKNSGFQTVWTNDKTYEEINLSLWVRLGEYLTCVPWKPDFKPFRRVQLAFDNISMLPETLSTKLTSFFGKEARFNSK